MANVRSWGGKSYDLSHLDDIEIQMELEEKSIRVMRLVRFSFSCHCYSRSAMNEEVVPADMVVPDGAAQRVFSEERYELSRLLPDVVKNLPNEKIYQTAHRNFLHLKVMNRLGVQITYLVALRIRRRPSDIFVMIESAYPIDAIEDKRKRTKPMRFKVALSRA